MAGDLSVSAAGVPVATVHVSAWKFNDLPGDRAISICAELADPAGAGPAVDMILDSLAWASDG